MRNRIFGQLFKQTSPFFKVSHSPEYKTFIMHHVLTHGSHPMYATQVRKAKQRKREGLWWHVTAGSETSLSSYVRTWARRRLREAVLEELKARGYDENGKVIKRGHLKDGKQTSSIESREKLYDITGSLRLHVQPPILPAKFVDVKAAASNVVRILVEGARPEATSKPIGRPDWNPPTQLRIKRTLSPR
jgi:hypothetical protein